MLGLDEHTINENISIKETLSIIDRHAISAIVLFVVDSRKRIIGSVTDGDIRRGILRGIDLNERVSTVMQPNFRSLLKENIDFEKIAALKNDDIFYVPIVDDSNTILEIINLHNYRIALPVDVVLMAGGKGQRLMPLTQNTPKPLLPVGNKPIIEHNLNRLANHGMTHVYISINYLGEQIVDYFGNGEQQNLSISYIRENKPLGTLGSVKLVSRFKSEFILIMNSDLLTDIDFYKFFKEFVSKDADMAIASTTYHVDIPYAVLESDEGYTISSLKEKPRYTYYSNAGIYLLKKELLDFIPTGEFYNVTDLIELLISKKKKVISFPILGYWLDIGKLDVYQKAQEDIKLLKL